MIFGSILYVSLGCFYNRQYGLSGMEATPNYEFWKLFPTHFINGCTFTYTFIKQRILKSKQADGDEDEGLYGGGDKKVGAPSARSHEDGL
jgi:hypothetical protein